VGKAIEFLQELWSIRDAQGDFDGSIQWDTVLVEKGWELLLY